ncbi:stalk domain-containing protein [Syntrophomonas curvata]
MKKIKPVKILILALCLTFALAGATLGALPTDRPSPEQAQAAGGSDLTILVNGEKIEYDVAPVIEKDRTMVPLRALAESLGAEVEWLEQQNQVIVSKNDCHIKLTIGEPEAYVNGQKAELEAPARIIGNRTLVPLRFIGESLNAEVNWLPAERKISVEIDRSVEPGAANIKINNFIWSPQRLTVAGKARVWEATLNYEVIDNNNRVLFDGFATASAGAPQWGDFTFSVDADLSEAEAIRVFTTSPKDGSRMDTVEYFLKPFGTATIISSDPGSILAEGILGGYSNQPGKFYFAVTPATIITDAKNKLLAESDLKAGDELQIWISYPGIVLESWPAQAGAGKIVRITP